MQKRRQDVALCLLLLLAFDHSLQTAAIVVIAASSAAAADSCGCRRRHIVLRLRLYQVTAGYGTQLQARPALVTLQVDVLGFFGAQVLAAIKLLLRLLLLLLVGIDADQSAVGQLLLLGDLQLRRLVVSAIGHCLLSTAPTDPEVAPISMRVGLPYS